MKNRSEIFETLQCANARPEVFCEYTASELWTDKHISQKMLEYHLDTTVDIASRNIETVNQSVEWLCSRLKYNSPQNIIDFGCGPGFYTTKFAQKGHNVTGIDFSERSLNYARNVASNENLSINYILQNYLEYKTENSYDLIIMLMCDYCALSPRQRNVMLDIFKSILKPGGVIAFDVYSNSAFEKREEKIIFEENLMQGFWLSEMYFGISKTFLYEKDKVALDKYTIIGDSTVKTIYNWLEYFSIEKISKELINNGFEIESYYSDLTGKKYSDQSDEIAILAKGIK